MTHLGLFSQGAATTGQPIPHPCLPKDSTLEAQGHEFVGEGSYARCQELVTGLFDTSSCLYPSCSFNGAYQPPLPAKMYGFSYLYDRTAAIGLLDGHPNEFGEQRVRIRELEHATEGPPTRSTRRGGRGQKRLGGRGPNGAPLAWVGCRS